MHNQHTGAEHHHGSGQPNGAQSLVAEGQIGLQKPEPVLQRRGPTHEQQFPIPATALGQAEADQDDGAGDCQGHRRGGHNRQGHQRDHQVCGCQGLTP
ncbi:MAG: hypothetical protein NTW83_00285 [Cyanobacteria bacterium]|nr:hypothetical protein [Cyanobacteriota bacterium]